MKIRIRGNSIRLRLTQSEVAAFGRTGQIVEHTEFAPGQRLTYPLRSCPRAAEMHATFADGTLTVAMPAALAREWVRGEEVEVYGSQPAGPGAALGLTVEKDFQCLHGEGEPDADAFPHPLAV